MINNKYINECIIIINYNLFKYDNPSIDEGIDPSKWFPPKLLFNVVIIKINNKKLLSEFIIINLY